MEETKNIRDTVAKAVVSRRNEIELEQETLCDYTDMSITTLSNLENSKANITIDKLGAILETLGLEISINVKKTV